MEKIITRKCDQEVIATLISDKINIKLKLVSRYKEMHYNLINWSEKYHHTKQMCTKICGT